VTSPSSSPLFTRWQKPDYAFAAHIGPMPLGIVAIKDGVVTSASDGIELTFHGVGAHGSMPDKSIDPIVEAAHFVTDVQTVISREKDPNLFGVVTVGSFIGGAVNNIIPDHADLLLTLRSRDENTRKLLIDGVERTARAAAEMARAPTPTIVRGTGVNAVRNDAILSARAAVVLKNAFGEDAIFIPAADPGINASEDFSVFIDEGIPSVFFGVGGSDSAMIARYRTEGKPLPVNHSPLFAPVPEPSIKRGAQALALAVMMVTGFATPKK
jgi:amidohydrolase